jgi:hypothetical protein
MPGPQLNANSFQKTNAVGTLDLRGNPDPNILTCRVNPASSVTSFSPGQVVKLVDLGGSDTIGGGVPVIDVVTLLTDAPLGVVVFGTRYGKVPEGLTAQVATDGAIVWMLSKAALARGVPVLADLDDANHYGYVQAVTGKTGKVLGITMDKVSGADQLVRIKIIANGGAFAGSVSS